MSFNTTRKGMYDESSLDQYLKEISAYPLLGAYVSCQGGPRCRGTLVAVYDEAPPTGGGDA